MFSAEKVAGIFMMSRQAVEKRRKAGRLIGVSLGQRGFGYPAWQFTERGTLPHLETVLEALKRHDDWTKLVFSRRKIQHWAAEDRSTRFILEA